MIKKRLLTLADALDKLAVKPRKRFTFSLAGWFRREKICGTTACAVGLASTLPEFKRLGLKIHDYLPAFRDLRGWYAVQKFFGISYDAAEYLFSYTQYESNDTTKPKAVADRIRALVNSGDRT